MSQALKVEIDPEILAGAQTAYELTAACQFRITEYLRQPSAKTQEDFLRAVATLSEEAERLIKVCGAA